MELFFKTIGQGKPMIILHGLMGSSDNWLTQSKLLADQYQVFMVDQRNHGRSSHNQEFDYKTLAGDLKNFIEQHGIVKPIVMGHSMGGKAAMNFAVQYPEMLDRLIVVDIAPKAYTVHHDSILEGLNAIPIGTLQSRDEADKILSEFVPEMDVRQFLLKNLSRKPEGGFAWKINLPVIDNNLEKISEGMQYDGTYTGTTLFIRGSKSNYVKDEDRSTIKSLFPNSTLITMDTGHWVQAEKPQEFVEIVKNFLAK
jgi:pimeloyl-ACP methyl ester carboxylesterase